MARSSRRGDTGFGSRLRPRRAGRLDEGPDDWFQGVVWLCSPACCPWSDRATRWGGVARGVAWQHVAHASADAATFVTGCVPGCAVHRARLRPPARLHPAAPRRKCGQWCASQRVGIAAAKRRILGGSRDAVTQPRLLRGCHRVPEPVELGLSPISKLACCGLHSVLRVAIYDTQPS